MPKLKVSKVDLVKRCLQSEKSLFNEVGNCGRYAHKDNGSNILAVAHCDWVDACHKIEIGELYVKTPRLDDRLGVYTILDLLPKMDINVDILLTTDEEIGASTADLFVPSKKYNWIVEFDRRGVDAATYHYYGMDKYAEKYFNVVTGSFSDISFMDIGCCGINVGVGYYREHSRDCFVNLGDYCRQMIKFKKFYNRFKDVSIPHVSAARKYYYKKH